MPDPVKTFKTLWTLLEVGGHLCIEVPNIEAADASPHNTFFKAHIFYYSGARLIACASPYFEPVALEQMGNLRILFRKKPKESVLTLPDEIHTAHVLRRLRQKGWWEYSPPTRPRVATLFDSDLAQRPDAPRS